jgi:hypothetical protein
LNLWWRDIITARPPDRETVLEVGLVTAVGLLMGGVAILLFGSAAGSARRRSRRHESPPAPGRVPRERHQNIATVSAR